jgi:hypothetical protein
MQHSKKALEYESDQVPLKNEAIDYIAAGVGCNCLVALSEVGLLAKIIDYGSVDVEDLAAFDNPLLLASALETLERSDVVRKEENTFYITEFGRALARYIGLITIFFDGYGQLVSYQGKISRNRIKNKNKWIRGKAISKAASSISEKMIDPIIVEEMLRSNVSGTVCDLGCGYGGMLSKICHKTGNPGLGFDSEPEVVRESRKKFEKTNITIELANIEKFEGVWENVVALIQCHVFHDFTPNQRCIQIMNSYLGNFPNLKYFFYIDTVSPSCTHANLFPGFDYVHGLLGIPTRNYEETVEMFSDSSYQVLKEVPLELPNTFLWILTPVKKG